jgi:putative zinc finger/helix-turn-helix YgiT family protein
MEAGMVEQVIEKLECFECGKLVTPRLEERTEILPVRGEPIEVLARVAVCPDCGADMSVEERDDATLVAAFDLYRQTHGLMTPEEMKQLRERYGLGVRPFSLLLGWGEITAHRYEGGSLQDAAHEAALRLAEDPANIRVYLSANGHKLTTRQRAGLEKCLQAIEARKYGRTEDPMDRLVARETQPGYGQRVAEARNSEDYRTDQILDGVTEAIVDRMRALGLSRRDLADRIGVSPARVTRLLRGVDDFTVKTLVEVSRVLDCDLSVSLVPRGVDPQAAIAEARELASLVPDGEDTTDSIRRDRDSDYGNRALHE